MQEGTFFAPLTPLTTPSNALVLQIKSSSVFADILTLAIKCTTSSASFKTFIADASTLEALTSPATVHCNSDSGFAYLEIKLSQLSDADAVRGKKYYVHLTGLWDTNTDCTLSKAQLNCNYGVFTWGTAPSKPTWTKSWSTACEWPRVTTAGCAATGESYTIYECIDGGKVVSSSLCSGSRPSPVKNGSCSGPSLVCPLGGSCNTQSVNIIGNISVLGACGSSWPSKSTCSSDESCSGGSCVGGWYCAQRCTSSSKCPSVKFVFQVLVKSKPLLFPTLPQAAPLMPPVHVAELVRTQFAWMHSSGFLLRVIANLFLLLLVAQHGNSMSQTLTLVSSTKQVSQLMSPTAPASKRNSSVQGSRSC
jgi:hypothetical protein